MVGLRGKETNIRLRKMVRHTREEHRIPVNIREFVYGGPNPNEFIHFCDIPNQNITFHIVNEITAKWSYPEQSARIPNRDESTRVLGCSTNRTILKCPLKIRYSCNAGRDVLLMINRSKL